MRLNDTAVADTLVGDDLAVQMKRHTNRWLPGNSNNIIKKECVISGNTIVINERKELAWYVGDSKMKKLMELLDSIGTKIIDYDNMILDESNVIQ